MLGALPPDPQWLTVAGGCPHTKNHNPLVANFWLCTWIVVSTRNANALHQNFLSITSTKELVHESNSQNEILSPVKNILNSPGKVLENDLKKSWKVLEFDFAVSVATLK